MLRTSFIFSFLWMGFAHTAHAQKVAYWPLEETPQEVQEKLSSAQQIVWQQIQTIDGVKKHKLLPQDRKRLKKCGSKISCLKTWLSKRGVFGLFYVKLVPQDEGLNLSLRFLDVQSEDRFKHQNIIWTEDLDLLNYRIEIMMRRWLQPQSLRGTIKIGGLTADSRLWVDDVEIEEGLMEAQWVRETQAGIHTIRVERNGFVPFAKNIEIRHRQETEVIASWRADPLYKVEEKVGKFNTRKLEVLIGTGVVGVSLLVWGGAAINTMIVGAEMQKRAEAQMLYGATHDELVSQGESSALTANIALAVVGAALGWNLYWGFQTSEDSP